MIEHTLAKLEEMLDLNLTPAEREMVSRALYELYMIGWNSGYDTGDVR